MTLFELFTIGARETAKRRAARGQVEGIGYTLDSFPKPRPINTSETRPSGR